MIFIDNFVVVRGKDADTDIVNHAEENKIEIVNELWLKNRIMSQENGNGTNHDDGRPAAKKRNTQPEPYYRKRYPEDTFLEDLIACESATCGYKVGMKCFRPENPEDIYVITKLDLCSYEKVVVTLESTKTESPPLTITIVDDYVECTNFSFLPTEEQVAFTNKYENREATEGVWRSQTPSDLLSIIQQLFDQFASSEVNDYAPGTDHVVRTLIDPSLYALRVDNSMWSLSSWWDWMV